MTWLPSNQTSRQRFQVTVALMLVARKDVINDQLSATSKLHRSVDRQAMSQTAMALTKPSGSMHPQERETALARIIDFKKSILS